MKRFSTLLTAFAVFLTVQVNAQNYFENFESGFASTGQQCIDTTDILRATNTSQGYVKGFVLDDKASAYVEPPVSGATIREFATPYLTLPEATTISFNYRMTQLLAGGATRFINVGYVDANDQFHLLDSIPLANIDTKVTYSESFSFPTGTIARVSLRFGGAGGDGNTRIAFDNISVNAPVINGGACNLAPIAYDNMYGFTWSLEMASGNVILDNTSITTTTKDTDPDGIPANLTANVVTGVPAGTGTLELYPNGDFIFMPSSTFQGGPISFTYSITDNGFPRLSDTATVYLNYPEAIFTPMPVKLISFAGSSNNNKGQLRWSVADNETGDEFVVLRSVDGRNFTEAGTVFISNKVGAESYNFTDSKELDAVTYFKLKIVNKDGSTSYSNVIILKQATTRSTSGITILKNPVESTLTFTYSATTATQGQVSIYNTVGVKVYSSRIASQKGTNSVSLNLDSHMAAGTYILEVVNGSERAVTRMIKQ